jgi:glycerol-3-phosphate dehydrogenase (NAD(P)+)
MHEVNWYVRKPENIAYIKTHHHNPNYLSYKELDTERIRFFDNMQEAIDHSDVLIFAIPAVFLKQALDEHSVKLDGKFLISAIKGIVPEVELTVTQYFHRWYGIPFTFMGVISGPCHAEEIALERLSYLSIASKRAGKVKKIAKKLTCEYVSTIVSRDSSGIEYAGVLKNIIAIASGICHGIGYGDNFQAVLVSNAFREISRFLRKTSRTKRRMYRSVYLGDLLVTAYSQFSRNRTFGVMLGKGYTVESARLEMNMIAEGYYAIQSIQDIINKRRVKMPIVNAVYKIVHENVPPHEEMERLAARLR